MRLSAEEADKIHIIWNYVYMQWKRCPETSRSDYGDAAINNACATVISRIRHLLLGFRYLALSAILDMRCRVFGGCSRAAPSRRELPRAAPITVRDLGVT